MLFVNYPKCSTCRKAKNWLDEHDIEYESRHIVEDNPKADELQKWHEIRGKSLLPPRRPGSRDHVERDLGEADALLREDVLAL